MRDAVCELLGCAWHDVVETESPDGAMTYYYASEAEADADLDGAYAVQSREEEVATEAPATEAEYTTMASGHEVRVAAWKAGHQITFQIQIDGVKFDEGYSDDDGGRSTAANEAKLQADFVAADITEGRLVLVDGAWVAATITWSNTFASAFNGAKPFLEISDGHQTYCAPLNGRTAGEMLESFRETYQHSDDSDGADPVAAWEIHEGEVAR